MFFPVCHNGKVCRGGGISCTANVTCRASVCASSGDAVQLVEDGPVRGRVPLLRASMG